MYFDTQVSKKRRDGCNFAVAVCYVTRQLPSRSYPMFFFEMLKKMTEWPPPIAQWHILAFFLYALNKLRYFLHICLNFWRYVYILCIFFLKCRCRMTTADSTVTHFDIFFSCSKQVEVFSTYLCLLTDLKTDHDRICF